MRVVGGATGLVFVGLLGWWVYTRSWLLVGTLVATVLLVAVLQVVGRSTQRRRRAQAGPADPLTWRVQLLTGQEELVRLDRDRDDFGSVPVDLVVGPDALRFVPLPDASGADGLHDRRIEWSDVGEVTAQDLGRTGPGGQLSFTRQTLVTVLLRGEVVPPMLRDDWEAWVADRQPAGERHDDAERESLLEVARQMRDQAIAGGETPGHLTVTFTTDAVDDLVERMSALARGGTVG